LIHPLKLFPVETPIKTTKLNNVQLHSLGFKVRRKRFLVETFVLPPEEEDDDKSKPKPTSTAGCSSSRSNKDPLDF
jgi:hypothetical protein